MPTTNDSAEVTHYSPTSNSAAVIAGDHARLHARRGTRDHRAKTTVRLHPQRDTNGPGTHDTAVHRDRGGTNMTTKQQHGRSCDYCRCGCQQWFHLMSHKEGCTNQD